MAGYPGAAHRLSGWYPHRSWSAGLGAAALLPAIDKLVAKEHRHQARLAMLQAAIALVRTEFHDVVDNPATIVNEFRTRFYDTNLLGDRYAGNKFAQYLFRRHDSPPNQHTRDHAHRIVEEAQLFIEAVYACRDSITERGMAGLSVKPPVQVGKAAR